MMRFLVHRGSREIGGSCVECIADGGGRLILDLGLPLARPDGGAWRDADLQRPASELTRDDVLPAVPGLFGDTPAPADRPLALILSHAHLDHTGLVGHAHPAVPVFASRGTAALLDVNRVFRPCRSPALRVEILPDRVPQHVGPFVLTAIPVDHSAPDAQAVLVEADGQRLLYSGDLRAHGRTRWKFEALCAAPPADVGVLLLEGTLVGQASGSHGLASEADVEDRFTELFQGRAGLVAVALSGQNLDRLVSLFRAVRRTGRVLVLDLYQAYVLHRLAFLSARIPRQGWEGVVVKQGLQQRQALEAAGEVAFLNDVGRSSIQMDGLARLRDRAVVIARSSGHSRRVLEKLGAGPGTLLVYSLWRGYWDGRSGVGSDRLRSWAEEWGAQVEFVHCSGHADPAALRRLVDAVRPRRVVPIHTSHPSLFREAGIDADRVDDNVLIDVPGASSSFVRCNEKGATDDDA